MNSIQLKKSARPLFAARFAAVSAMIAMAAIWMLTGVSALQAQATDGIIVGTVADATGASIPNATVTATNKGTGVRYTTTTTGAGDYRINNVPIGAYDVDATASGMTPMKIANVAVDLNRTTTTNFSMQVASVSQTVEVQEAAPLIDTSSAQLESNFSVEMALNLPAAGNYLNDTGVLNLSLLAPGVTQ